jgi:hypothetical protein
LPFCQIEREGHALGFDGASRIDVGITGNGRVLACEAKLGETRSSVKRFNEEFLEQLELSHKGTRLKGNTMAVLDGRFPESVNARESLRARLDDDSSSVVCAEWVLIIRKSVVERWGGSKPVLRNCAVKVAAEEVAEEPGTDFQKIASELIGSETFANDWHLG